MTRGAKYLWLVAAAVLFFAGGAAVGTFVLDTDDPTPRRGRQPAPTPEPSPTPSPEVSPHPRPAAVCSAAEMSATPEVQEGLPAPVAEMRRAIVGAAVACGYSELEDLALAGGEGFTFSFGASEGPGRYWRSLERRGDEEVLRLLVATLNLPYCIARSEGEVLYQWPSAHCADAGDEDWAYLEDLYSEDEIERMRAFGGFLGWRAGITKEGDWRFYVAGD